MSETLLKLTGKTRFVDLTPTWQSVLPILIETAHHPDSQIELRRMAALADAANPLSEACQAVLLFYTVGPWTDECKDQWRNLTGKSEATTKVLGDTIRAALEKVKA